MITSCMEGNIEAREAIVKRHHQSIFSLVTRLAGASEAEDITQEVFLRAFRSLPSFRGESTLSTWLYRIAVNICRDRARKGRKRLPFFSLDEPLLADEGQVGWQIPDPAPTPDELVEQDELSERVQEALESLPEIHRIVLVLHGMQGLRYDEIAQVVGCSVGTVKSRLFYARRKVGQRLSGYWQEGR